MTDYDEHGVIQDGRFKGSHTRPPSVHGGQREIVWHRPVPATVQGTGRKSDTLEHPAWGLIRATLITATPGAVLFDSDIRHQHLVRVTLQRASRERDLNRDWIHDTGPDLIEVDMSQAQWGAFVSSFGSSGVPCTIRATETNANVDGMAFEPRLQESLDEIKGAADKSFGKIKEAMAAFDALDPKAGAKDKREALSRLRNAVQHVEGNLTFAAQSLEEHAEKVVAKSRADIEAMVYNHAERLGLDPAGTLNHLALGGPADTPALDA